ncbi:Nudix hydrolase [Thalictrum thalictroides]|uniref:Nudix hydrolase n=1 Tax=Thalictrum thalictroides TaxID=46969 RepID=A0A7J6VBC7_THATH|nr:Nudix hydrolase [Thalictrum thalictroides]
MYVSFLAGCFRSIRFGLEEAHGKGQALQFNWLFEKGAFVLHTDGTFSVNFEEIEGAVESLSTEILTIQAKGDKAAAKSLLLVYGTMTEPLQIAMNKLETVQVPVDIACIFNYTLWRCGHQCLATGILTLLRVLQSANDIDIERGAMEELSAE